MVDVNKPQSDAAVATAALRRLPSEPYPGLRPFLDFEAALLFGRERQVREVIARLKQSQFVAVLGGSGSGKSSLIHAGVVPELRSFGIPGAGDLWLPMAVTPGTNVSEADRLAVRRSPITRLARRFAERLLRSRGSAQADEARVVEIAQVFRQEAGFARLMDVYAKELSLPPGPDPEEARVLFVLDQFEEVFHPTNKDVADAKLLVERVLDHFFNPHPRCHVVLTMRSEHLNDCAAFLELPDAINKSSYLIRRLDSDELREAIVGPAQRFLRLVSRSETSPLPLPDEVVFEAAVLQRLMRDVQALTHDPDHLPLLQHLLARLWQSALENAEIGTLVPASITERHLVRAVFGGNARAEEASLPDDLNALRASVNNWPEALYALHDTQRREQLDGLFRHLAFKDPNTGLYSQQRVDVDQAASRLGQGKTAQDLRLLVGEGFLGAVDYLYWDDDDPARITLKVSHESFIRGWQRFRSLVDVQSLQFDEYLAVLRKCAEWAANGRNEDYLFEMSDMRRLSASGFVDRLHDPEKSSSWMRLLAMDRDADHLRPVAAEVPAYLAASTQRLDQRRLREEALRQGEEELRQRAERTRRNMNRWMGATVGLTVLFALLPTTLFSWLVQGPTMRRAELLFEAGNRANQALLNPSQRAVGDAADTLQSMLLAGALVDQARQGAGTWRMVVSKQVLDGVGTWPLFKDQSDFLDNVFMQAEPPVNGTLRQLMQGALWRAAPADSTAANAEQPLPTPEVLAAARCVHEGTGARRTSGRLPADLAAQTLSEAPTGRLFVLRRADRAAAAGSSGEAPPADGRQLRALFVPDRPAYDRTLEVFSASVDPGTDACTLGTSVLSSPEVLNSSVVFDASLRVFYYTTDGRGGSPGALIVQELDWERGSDGLVQAWQRQTLTTLSDANALAAVKAAAGPDRAAVAPTWRVPGGRVVAISGKRWMMVSSQAQRVELSAAQAEGLRPLVPAGAGSACAALSNTFAEMPGFGVQNYEQGEHCFRIATGWPGEATARPVRDDLRVSVHERPSLAMLQRAQENPPAPLAAMVPFARVTPPESSGAGAVSWWVGTAGPWDGWLLMKTERGPGSPAAADTPLRYIGLPWSTCALWRVGRSVQQHNPAPGAGGKTAATLTTACQLP